MARPCSTVAPTAGNQPTDAGFFENDWLEAIVARRRTFYNTGHPDHIWCSRNDKPEKRKGCRPAHHAQDLYAEMDESLGEKRHELTQDHIDEISRIFGDLEANGRSKVVPTEGARLPSHRHRSAATG